MKIYKFGSTAAIMLTSIWLLWSCGGSHQDKPVSDYWPQWRGPNTNGMAAENAAPPIEWNDSLNIRWKTVIPGTGNSTPVVWENLIYVTTAIPIGEAMAEEAAEEAPEESRQGQRRRMPPIEPDRELDFALVAVDRRNGKIAWQKSLRKAKPHEGTHNDGSWASNSPITDGKHIFAHFGSNGLFCLDMSGNLIWEKDLGDMRTRNGFGEGSSPALAGDYLVINWDHEDDSFIAVLNKNSGDEIWRSEREEVTSWSTPLIVSVNGKQQVIVSATNKTRGYDLQNGEIIWEAGGMTLNTIPSPVEKNGVVYLMSGFRGNALQAIRLKDARGDISDSEAILWSYDRDTPYVPSPLLYDNYLYFLKRNNAMLSCFDAIDGKAMFGPVRLEGLGGIYASPVGAAGNVYIASLNGTTTVVKHDSSFQVLATNRLDDRFFASPIVLEKALYLRGRNYLYCIADPLIAVAGTRSN